MAICRACRVDDHLNCDVNDDPSSECDCLCDPNYIEETEFHDEDEYPD